MLFLLNTAATSCGRIVGYQIHGAVAARLIQRGARGRPLPTPTTAPGLIDGWGTGGAPLTWGSVLY